MSNDLRFRATMDDKVSGPLTKMKDKFDLLGKSKGAQSILQGVGQGLGQAALKRTGDILGFVTDTIGDSIKAASDMAETQSKVGVVFGKSAKDIDMWGNTAAKSLGLSKQAAEESAASLGNLFTGIGQTQAEAASMSKSVVQLAADLASFNNIDPTEALDKLRSGLAGESEPLRALGVFLSEAKVKTKAMQMGLGDAHGELSEGEKILARYQIILDETSTSQGDFARTSEGLANQQRITNAELQDAKARLGETAIGWELFWTKAQIGALDFLAANPLEKINQGLRNTSNVIFPWTKPDGPAQKMATGLRDSALDMAGSAIIIGSEWSHQLGPKGQAAQAAFRFGSVVASNLRQSNDDVLSASEGLIAEIKKPFLNKKAIEDILSGKGSMGKKLAAGLKSARPNVVEAAQELRDSLIRALAADISIEVIPNLGPHAKAKHRAMGGPADPFEAYTVGEHGEETLVMGSRVGTIVPNGGGGNMGHGHDIYMDGHLVARAQSERLYGDYSRGSPSATRK